MVVVVAAAVEQEDIKKCMQHVKGGRNVMEGGFS